MLFTSSCSRPDTAAGILCLLFAGLITGCTDTSAQRHTAHAAPAVAIVGAGVGGSCTAHFLRGLLGEAAQLDV